MTRQATGGSLAARFVVLGEHTLEHAELCWDDRGCLRRVRRSRGPVRDVCVIPGLVDAHCHLHIDVVPGAPRRFVPWLGAVMARRATLPAAAEVAATRTAIRGLLQSGTTAVGDIDATGRAFAPLSRSPLAGRQYRELTGFHLAATAARALVHERALRPAGALAVGLSPHAPYSVSPALFRAAASRSRHLAIHCAEVPEEQQFLRSGTGPFAELLASLGRLPAAFRAPGVGAVKWLERLGVLRPTTLLVHCQELERGDVTRLASAGVAIVVCPGTIEYFQRAAPPVPRWLAAGIPVALGTDSRASNPSWSMLDELRRAARLWPSLGPTQLLQLATTNGGRALDLPRLGRLGRGGRADFCLLPAANSAAASVEALVHGEAPVLATYCAGRRFGTKSAAVATL